MDKIIIEGLELFCNHGVLEEENRLLGEFLSGLKNVQKIEALPYHSMAKPKYENLGMEYPMGRTPNCTKENAARV